jgi:hypothetical protein
MMISVIIPSRLQRITADEKNRLWLERALDSVRRQTIYSQESFEIIVGLDPEARLPNLIPDVTTVNAARPTQAHAVNAAASVARGDIMAILEDDDLWEPRRLEYGLACLERCDLVTSNQLEVTEDGAAIKVMDYATPSGWLMPKAIWKQIGDFNESIQFHVDMEYLGRVNDHKLRRIHLVEAGAERRHGLNRIAKFSEVLPTDERDPLVIRTVNSGGGMARILSEEEARRQSIKEFRFLWERHGYSPW